ncbi:hypothetical protein HSHS1_09650 [Helicobacter suis HS1]|nr:hypothetical protein HSHS1_09650 [Helicobacter suis HS1]
MPLYTMGARYLTAIAGRWLLEAILSQALDNGLSYMSTKLEGAKTHFSPFNRGLNDGSGELDRECGAAYMQLAILNLWQKA